MAHCQFRRTGVRLARAERKVLRLCTAIIHTSHTFPINILADSTMSLEATAMAFRALASLAGSSAAHSREAPDSAVSLAARASAHAGRVGQVRATSAP